jgi:4-oxalocrotonate tautomerase
MKLSLLRRILMPIIQIHLLEGRSQEMKEDLVMKVTQAVCESLGTKEEQVRIILSEMQDQHYAIGGTTMAAKKGQQGCSS